MTRRLQITAPVASYRDAEIDIVSSAGVCEVRPDTARTIASWFASPGTHGHVLASLSTGCDVEVSELLDDIARVREEFPRDYGERQSNWRALDMLATFAMATPR